MASGAEKPISRNGPVAIFSDVEAKLTEEVALVLKKAGILTQTLDKLKQNKAVEISPYEASSSVITIRGSLKDIGQAETFLIDILSKLEGNTLSLSVKAASLPDLSSIESDEHMKKSVLPSRAHSSTEDLQGTAGPEHLVEDMEKLGIDDGARADGFGHFSNTNFAKDTAYFSKTTHMPCYIWTFMKQKCWTHILSVLQANDVSMTNEEKDGKVHITLKCYQKEKVNGAAEEIYDILSFQPIGKTTINLSARLRQQAATIMDIVFTASQQANEVVIEYHADTIDVIGSREKVEEAMKILTDQLTKCDDMSRKWLHSPLSTLYTLVPLQGPVVHVYKADISDLPVQILVCPTNGNLATSAGVAGAINIGGGKSFKRHVAEWLQKNGRLEMAHIAKTPGGDLKCEKVYHVNGPRADSGVLEASVKLLHEAFYNCISKANKENAISIAIPAISCGSNGFPADQVTTAMVEEVSKYITRKGATMSLKEIHLVDINEETLENIAVKLKKSGIGDVEKHSPKKSYAVAPPKASHDVKEVGFEKALIPKTSRKPARKFRHESLGRSMISPVRRMGSREYPEMKRPVLDAMATMPPAATPSADGDVSSDRLFKPPPPPPEGNMSFLHSLRGHPLLTGSSEAKISKRLPESHFKTKSTALKAKKKASPKRVPAAVSESITPTEGCSSAESEETCCICLDKPTNPKTLDKCKHKFCTDCIDEYFKKCNPKCPVCGTVYGALVGNQPKDGAMSHAVDEQLHLPGYETFGTIVIHYKFPAGTQTDEHPHPGKPYPSTYRRAYLPNNPQGQKLLGLLKRAFESRLMFTIGQSVTTGYDGVITWNDIHHKTNTHGGPTRYGYPDPTYLDRLEDELGARGIK